MNETAALAETAAYRGNRPRNTQAVRDWHAGAIAEPAIEPELAIVDAHHHLFGAPEDAHFYRREDYERDIAASGHNVIGTVWIEAYGIGWRTGGPEELRSVGEVEQIVRASATPLRSAQGECRMAAAIVANVDLTLGDRVDEVLDVHAEAAAGRLRGVRQHATYDDGPVVQFMTPARQHLLAEPAFRRGMACLGRRGLSFEAMVFHTQLGDVRNLADAAPEVPIVLNHLGQVLGVAQYAARREAVFEQWKLDMRELAARPNICVKLGGMGMPMFGFGFEGGQRPGTSSELLLRWRPYLEYCIDTFGPERCMFEANFPVDGQSCGYSAVWNAFKLATQGLSRDERRGLFYRTACKVYRLPGLEAVGDRA